MLDKLMQAGVVVLGILIGHLAPPSSTSPTSKIRSRQKAGALTAAPRGIIPAQRSKNMRNRLFFTSSVILAVLALTVIAWGADSNVGTWKLNLDKSKYSPGPAPKSQTLTIEALDDGIKYTANGENAKGFPIHVEFTAKYDGSDNPVTGSPDFNSIALKRIDAHTIEATIKKDGMVMGTSRTVISHDGQTRTLTSKGKNAAGQDVNNVVVYDKQ